MFSPFSTLLQRFIYRYRITSRLGSHWTNHAPLILFKRIVFKQIGEVKKLSLTPQQTAHYCSTASAKSPLLRIEENRQGWLSFFGNVLFAVIARVGSMQIRRALNQNLEFLEKYFFTFPSFWVWRSVPQNWNNPYLYFTFEKKRQLLPGEWFPFVKDWLSQCYRRVYRTMHPMPIPWIVFITHCNQFVSSREESRCGTNRLFDTTSPRVILLPSSRAIHGQTFDWYWIQDITASASMMIGKPIYLDKAIPSTDWQEWEMGGRIVRVHAVEFMLSQASFLDTK